MQKALRLSKEEKMSFMRALYSVFFRDQRINSIERSVLKLLNQCFDISTREYKSYVHNNIDDIAKEINTISDVRVRVYFMRIIRDVYHKEIKEIFRGPTTDHAKKFITMYGSLKEGVDLKNL